MLHDRRVTLRDPQFGGCFANAAVGVALLDAQGRLLEVNPTFCRISGYEPDELIGYNLSVFVDEECRKQFGQLAAGAIPGYSVERRYWRKDGSGIWCRVSIMPWSNLSGGVDSLLVIAEDLTKQKTLEEQVRQSQKLETLGLLAGGVAHDFNNLLMIINGYASSLREMLHDRPEGAHAQAIEEAGMRAAALTRQLLSFSRKQVMTTEPLVVDDLLRSAEVMLRRLVRENIEFDIRLGSDNATILGDFAQIQQLLLNLLANSSDAMPHGGQLLVETKRVEIAAANEGDVPCGKWLIIVVRDSGQGMDKAILERAFEPFFTTKSPGKGTGLGLATVYDVVQQNRGHIRVHSKPGVGTEFNIYLPLACDGTVCRNSRSSHVPCRHHNLRATVLLVEDELNLRRCLASTLTTMGCQVLEAANGREACTLMQTRLPQIHLVITDMVMPGMDGVELVRLLRQTQPGLPVLFMSGYAGIEAQSEELRRVNTEFFQKPFTAERLCCAVEHLLAQTPAHPCVSLTSSPVVG